MALIDLPKLEPRYYTYIGVAFTFVGTLLILLSIALILMPGWDFGFSYMITSAVALGALLIATLSFHQIGKKKIPV